MQRFHRFFDGRIVVPAMDLIEIDIIGAETLQAMLDFSQECFARKAAPLGSARIGLNTLVAITTSSRLAKSRKARPTISSLTPIRIHVGGIEEIDAGFESAFEETAALLFVQAPIRAISGVP